MAAFATHAAQAESGDITAGKAAFTRCAACHSITPGVNLVGPPLAGVVGRKVGSIANFRYSPALSSAHEAWTPERLSAWLADPAKMYPGNRMPFNVQNEKDRRDLVAYLASLSSTK
ncbi:c-type cytochrome [Caballeronia hypogeia]